MWSELLLRLEQTPVKWLHVAATTQEDYKSAASALTRRAKKSDGVVEVSARMRLLTVFVRRGPNWLQREAGSLAHMGADPLDAPGDDARLRAARNQQRQNGRATDAPRYKPSRPRKVREPETD